MKDRKPICAEHSRFLEEMAQAMGCSVESLVQAGYDESVPQYIANGKTAQQVAAIVMSNTRRWKLQGS